MPLTDKLLPPDLLAASPCFVNARTMLWVAEMQPDAFGLPPWHLHPDGSVACTYAPPPPRTGVVSSPGSLLDVSLLLGQQTARSITD